MFLSVLTGVEIGQVARVPLFEAGVAYVWNRL